METTSLMTMEDYKKFREKTPIGSAVINLTDECNLRCKYCFTHPNPRKMTLPTLQRVIRFLQEEEERTGYHGHKMIAFFGGEPMLMFNSLIKPFFSWMESEGLLKDDEFRFTMTTNGVFLTEENLKYLYDHRCHLLLSIDGDEFTQNDQRPTKDGKGSFDLVFPNIDNTLKYNPEITFRSTLEPRNAHLVFENYLFARKCGFQSFYVCPNQSADWKEEDVIIYLKELSLCIEQMYTDIKTDQRSPLYVSNFCQHAKSFFYGSLNTMNSRKKEFADKYGKGIFRCGLGTIGMGVGCDGEINACQEHNTYNDKNDIFYIGDVFNGIDPDRHLRLINTYLQPRQFSCKDHPDFCKDCPSNSVCGLDFCPSQNVGKNGDLLMNSFIHCAEGKFSGEVAKLLMRMIDKEEDEEIKKRLISIFQVEVMG